MGTMRLVRKRYRILFFSALVALIVPVGYALSIESAPKTPRYTAVPPIAAAVVAAPMIMNRVVADAAPSSITYLFSDSTKLLLAGTVLVGLAAAVRRVI